MNGFTNSRNFSNNKGTLQIKSYTNRGRYDQSETQPPIQQQPHCIEKQNIKAQNITIHNKSNLHSLNDKIFRNNQRQELQLKPINIETQIKQYKLNLPVPHYTKCRRYATMSRSIHNSFSKQAQAGKIKFVNVTYEEPPKKVSLPNVHQGEVEGLISDRATKFRLKRYTFLSKYGTYKKNVKGSTNIGDSSRNKNALNTLNICTVTSDKYSQTDNRPAILSTKNTNLMIVNHSLDFTPIHNSVNNPNSCFYGPFPKVPPNIYKPNKISKRYQKFFKKKYQNNKGVNSIGVDNPLSQIAVISTKANVKELPKYRNANIETELDQTWKSKKELQETLNWNDLAYQNGNNNIYKG